MPLHSSGLFSFTEMKHLFVPYELAVKLKEKGFDEPCLAVYRGGNNIYFNGELSGYLSDIGNVPSNSTWDTYLVNKDNPYHWTAAPLYQQVVDWFAEKHEIEINYFRVPVITDNNPPKSYCVKIKDFKRNYWGEETFINHDKKDQPINHWYNKNEALNKAIEAAFKLI